MILFSHKFAEINYEMEWENIERIINLEYLELHVTHKFCIMQNTYMNFLVRLKQNQSKSPQGLWKKRAITLRDRKEGGA